MGRKKLINKKIIKADEDLSEGLPLPDHIDEANNIPEGIIYSKNNKIKVKNDKTIRKKSSNKTNNKG